VRVRTAASGRLAATAADRLIQDSDALIVLLDALPNRQTAAAIYYVKSSRPILGDSPSIIKSTDKEEIRIERVRGLLGGDAIAKCLKYIRTEPSLLASKAIARNQASPVATKTCPRDGP
jgi:hypothetical protein